MKYLFLLFSISFYGQGLHHQMISSQGTSAEIAGGFQIMQTVGQQSSVGTSSNDHVVMQGFQQSYWGKYISSNKTDSIDAIKTTVYPNPFTAIINFQFSQTILEPVNVTIFDINGRLIYKENKTSVSDILTLDLSKLPTSEYLIRLNTSNFNYYTKIIKK